MASADHPGDVKQGRPLRPGMILFYRDGPGVWTVLRVGKQSTTLAAHDGTCGLDATLRGNTLPRGWSVVQHDPLIAYLAGQVEAQVEPEAMAG